MSEKTVLITGCSSGFGRLLVPEFLRAGWRVIATMRHLEERGEGFREERAAHGDRLSLVALDVTSAGDRAAAGDLIERRFDGRLDCLVNNAGYGLSGAVEDLSEKQIREQMETNFFALVLLTRRLLPPIRAARGRIINLSSVLGYSAMPLAVMYCASKYAVEGFSEGLYHELKPHGVQVALVEPGAFRTGFGDKIVWGEKSFDERSPYRDQTESYARFRERRAAGEGTSPAPVVNAIMRLAGMKEMPMRVRCGKDAKGIYAARRLLPEFLQTLAFTAVYKRMFSGKS